MKPICLAARVAYLSPLNLSPFRLQECDFARYSLDRLQKQTRVTRVQELEAELRMVHDEVRRRMALNKVMQQRMMAAQAQTEAFVQQAAAGQKPGMCLG